MKLKMKNIFTYPPQDTNTILSYLKDESISSDEKFSNGKPSYFLALYFYRIFVNNNGDNASIKQFIDCIKELIQKTSLPIDNMVGLENVYSKYFSNIDVLSFDDNGEISSVSKNIDSSILPKMEKIHKTIRPQKLSNLIQNVYLIHGIQHESPENYTEIFSNNILKNASKLVHESMNEFRYRYDICEKYMSMIQNAIEFISEYKNDGFE